MSSLAGIADSAVAVATSEGLRQGSKGETGGLLLLGGVLAGALAGAANHLSDKR